MPVYEITCEFSNVGTRNQVRMNVVNKLSEENPGTGKGDLTSKYIYYVENLSDGRRVYLVRPAFLHNGFDFVVNVEGIDFASKNEKKKRENPKHDDIIDDLIQKQQSSPELYKKLFNLINAIYNCEDVTYSEYCNINFEVGYSVELILKTIKWLFIEQDIRYWNYSGRNMLMCVVPRP